MVLENDANAAAMGEKWLGAAAGVDDMCMFTLGTGVGGGLVLQGQIWHGMTGMAGELGHINVEPDGHPCNCGSRGCLEQYASATAIKRMAQEAIASGNAPHMARALKEDVEFNSKMIFDLAMQGDAQARTIFERVGKALGTVIADMVNIFNFPMYVIGGGVSSAWDAFAPLMLETVGRNSFVYRATAPTENKQAGNAPSRSVRGTMITKALLGGDAGLIGAARLPMIAGFGESGGVQQSLVHAFNWLHGYVSYILKVEKQQRHSPAHITPDPVPKPSAGPPIRILSAFAINPAPLRISRDYRLLFLSQTISFLGSMMSFVVLPWQMYQLTHSSLIVRFARRH